MTEINSTRIYQNNIKPKEVLKKQAENSQQLYQAQKTSEDFSKQYLPGGAFAYPNMPYDRRLIAPTTNKPSVIVYDTYVNKTDFDNDGKPDESHGFYVESRLKNSDITRKSHQTDLPEPYSFNALTDDKGKTPHAITVSIGQSWNYEKINAFAKFYKDKYNSNSDIPQITPNNLKENMPKIRKAMNDVVSRPENKEKIEKSKQEYLELLSKSYQTDPKSEEGKKLNHQMDKIIKESDLVEISFLLDSWNEIDKSAKAGVPVVIAAGNKICENYSKLFSGCKIGQIVNITGIGSEDAIIVGSKDKTISVEHSLIDIYGPSSNGDTKKQLPTLSSINEIKLESNLTMAEKQEKIKTSVIPQLIYSSKTTSCVTPLITDEIVAPLSQKGYSTKQIKKIVQGAGKMHQVNPNLSLRDAANNVIILNNYQPEGKQ